MRAINRIIVHCSYTSPDMNTDAAEIRRWHVQERGWRDIGYHYVIKRDGTIEPGRPESEAGAHVAGHNADSIGVCLVGGKVSGAMKADCNFTRHQWRSLESLVTTLKGRYPAARIMGHRDLAMKECPTFDAAAWWG